MQNIQERIQSDIRENPVVLFMKGTAQMPQCGFSAVVVQILNSLSVSFKDINVLVDHTIRQGIKDFSNWPTIPQLYVKGEFIGGCDIVREMHQAGELEALLREQNIISESTLPIS
jgi:monothiol glutaredoxin